jgi:hypothetical protein
VIDCQAGGVPGKNFADRIGQRHLAVFDLQHHRGRREHLAERSGLEDCLGRDGDLVLDVREAVALRLHDGAGANDRNGHARNVLAFHLGADHRVHSRNGIGLRCGAHRRKKNSNESGQEQARERHDGILYNPGVTSATSLEINS